MTAVIEELLASPMLRETLARLNLELHAERQRRLHFYRLLCRGLSLLGVLIWLSAPVSLRAERPDPVMAHPIRISILEGYTPNVLEFLRLRATHFLREVKPGGRADLVMNFDYRFDPTIHRPHIHYECTNHPYGDALKEILKKFGLAYEILSVDRIAIIDDPNPAPATPAPFFVVENQSGCIDWPKTVQGLCFQIENSVEQVLWPKTIDEAVQHLLNKIEPSAQREIQMKTEADLVDFHIGLGMAIRNSFGLWRGNRQLLLSTGEEHPDDASSVIVHALWKKLQEMKK